jgi:hypothetical protein
MTNDGLPESWQQKSGQARGAATKRLRTAHQDEYDRYLAEERKARGLPPETGSTAETRLRGRVAELEAQLRAAGINA